MKITVILTMAVLLGQALHSQRIILYEHNNFAGRYKVLALGNHRFFGNEGADFNDIASAIKIPEGMAVILYEHANETGGYGRVIELVQNCSDLATYGINDKVSFVQVIDRRENDFRGNVTWRHGQLENGRYIVGQWTTGCGGPAASTSILPGAELPEQRRVSSKEEFLQAISDGFKGEILIPYTVTLDLTGLTDIHLRSGTSLIGERGPLGKRPVIIDNYTAESHNLFYIDSNDIRIEGISFIGHSGGSRSKQEVSFAIRVEPDYDLQLGRTILIANNEFKECTGAAVKVDGKISVVDPADYTGRRKPDAGLRREIRIERNYFHHNAMNTKGYGVVIGGGCFVTIEGNVFDFNRHAISAGGQSYSGYFAKFNYCLNGGYTEGFGYYNQHFDIHGADTTGYGGTAGLEFEVANNTFRGEQSYYIVNTRPAFLVRGQVLKQARFTDNVCVHNDEGAAVRLKGLTSELLYHVSTSGNQYDKDYSTEIATGDFDGDGRTDVFVANGTAWFFSHAGITHWEWLHASNKRTGELHIADIDNDGKSDVLYRSPDGRLGYLSGGVKEISYFTGLPVPINALRSGDFDGDGCADLFYTNNGQWYIWYGSRKTWVATQSSSLPVTELLLGEFDGITGTDIAAVVNNQWSYSKSGTGTWVRLNQRLSRSFKETIAADFDGDGLTDIALTAGTNWKYSPGGSKPLKTLLSNIMVPIIKMQVGKFDSGKKAQLLTFAIRSMIGTIQYEDRLWYWPGINAQGVSSGSFRIHSTQNMR